MTSFTAERAFHKSGTRNGAHARDRLPVSASLSWTGWENGEEFSVRLMHKPPDDVVTEPIYLNIRLSRRELEHLRDEITKALNEYGGLGR